MNQVFKEGYKDIKAPEELKQQTLEKMLQLNEQIKNTSDKMHKGGRNNYRYYYGGIALLACAAILGIVFLGPARVIYKTPMEDGNYYEEVLIRNGKIKFIENRVAISITPSAGYNTGGMSQTENKEEELLTEETPNGGSLVFKEREEIALPQIREEGWSYIGKQKIYVTVLKTEENRYQAVYEKDRAVYEVIGTNVTQKEFIDFLYRCIR